VKAWLCRALVSLLWMGKQNWTRSVDLAKMRPDGKAGANWGVRLLLDLVLSLVGCGIRNCVQVVSASAGEAVASSKEVVTPTPLPTSYFRSNQFRLGLFGSQAFWSNFPIVRVFSGLAHRPAGTDPSLRRLRCLLCDHLNFWRRAELCHRECE
jgi:hypothetical protein